MPNEYNDRNKLEQETANSAALIAVISKMNELINLMEETQKEVNKIREDLRNLDKLRPLRKKEEPAK